MSPTTPDQPRRPIHPEIDPSGADQADPKRSPEPALDRLRAAPRRTTGPPVADQRPTRRVPAQRPGAPEQTNRAPLVVAAVVATCWAALVSYLPVAVVLGAAQLAEDAGGIGGAARIGFAGWLLGHGVPLGTAAGPLGLPPLALAGFAAWRVARAGVHVSRAVGARHRGTPRQALTVATAVGLVYGMLGTSAALIVGTGELTVSPLRAGLTLAAFGTLAALVGAMRTTGALGTVARQTPPVLRNGLRTGLVAAFLLLGAGAGVAGLAVATGGAEASDMIGAYRTGVLGQANVTLVSLGYAPNAAVWAASYLLGPGFAVGTDTVVRSSEVTLGALPAVPLLAGLPHGPVDGIGTLVLAVPLFAGMTAGWLLTRRIRRTIGDEYGPVPRDRRPLATQRPTTRGGPRAAGARTPPPVGWAPLVAAAAIGGPVAGLVLGVAALVSSGPLGGGRLAEIGPVYWQVAVVAALVVAVGTLIGATATRYFTRP